MARRRATVNPPRLAEMLGAQDGRRSGLVLLTSDPHAEATGLYCDGTTFPEDEPCTVKLKATAAWPGGFGVYLGAAKKGQLLACVFPEGAPARGAIEVGPVNCDEDAVPSPVQRRPQDVWLLLGDQQDVRLHVAGVGCILRLEAPLIEIKTTGVATTSKVIVDGVPWAGLQLQTPAGPTVGPPVAGPGGIAAQTALATWKQSRQET